MCLRPPPAAAPQDLGSLFRDRVVSGLCGELLLAGGVCAAQTAGVCLLASLLPAVWPWGKPRCVAVSASVKWG